MPKQIKNKQKYLRSNVDNYHDELKYMIKSVGYWPHGNMELQEFIDQDKKVIFPEPDEFREFRETWESVRCAGIVAGMYQNLHPQNLKTLARALFASASRRKYYIKLINDRLTRDPSEHVAMLSIIELERRYQYYLYKKNCKRQGLKNDLDYECWRESGDCVTFYDKPRRCQLFDYNYE